MSKPKFENIRDAKFPCLKHKWGSAIVHIVDKETDVLTRTFPNEKSTITHDVTRCGYDAHHFSIVTEQNWHRFKDWNLCRQCGKEKDFESILAVYIQNRNEADARYKKIEAEKRAKAKAAFEARKEVLADCVRFLGINNFTIEDDYPSARVQANGQTLCITLDEK